MPEFWSRRGWQAWLLLPLSLLYYVLSTLRRIAYRHGLRASWQPPVVTVVVGNITAGGSGKTPLIIGLVKTLQDNEVAVGVVSRGYRGEKLSEPLLLDTTTTAAVAGDEPVLISDATGVPVCVFPKRVKAVGKLLGHESVEVILCDDGLQHYALARDIEIAVVNTDTRYGNGWMLPAGPLREPLSRLESVDYIVRNERSAALPPTPADHSATISTTTKSFSYRMETVALCRLDGQQRIACDAASPAQIAEQFAGNTLVAMPGIANPQRFFNFLETIGLEFELDAKSDHHQFGGQDFPQNSNTIYLITEKDKVKCRDLQIDASRIWYTETIVRLDKEFEIAFINHVRDIISNKPET